MNTSTHTYTYTNKHTQNLQYNKQPTYTHTHIHKRTHTKFTTQMHAHTHTQVHQRCTHKPTHTHTQAHTHTHKCTMNTHRHTNHHTRTIHTHTHFVGWRYCSLNKGISKVSEPYFLCIASSNLLFLFFCKYTGHNTLLCISDAGANLVVLGCLSVTFYCHIIACWEMLNENLLSLQCFRRFTPSNDFLGKNKNENIYI